MDQNQLLNSLNPSQQEAVLDFEHPLLILAGAGSGKTRMLTNKIAYGIEKGFLTPQSFLAVTFTNKAAGEMKSRISKLVGNIQINDSWIATFHSFGNRLLRTYSEKLGYTKDFTILDSADQTSLTKSILKNLKYDNSSANARKIARQIQSFKSDLNAIKDPDNYPWTPISKKVYEIYERELKKLNAFDFSDLLLKTHELLHRFPEVVEELRSQFNYILVDEYQDTNLIQYEILKKLSRDKNNICAVGDEDQSIYSWRGANIFNILNFEKDFPQSRVIKLEQNYRSTKNIIGAATAVISNNVQRKGKTLFTENDKGELLEILESPTEYDEALSIAYKIRKTIEKGEYTYSDIAIFYRTNAQSRVLEEKLRNFDIPYKIFGGLKFYDRKEIKDINSYMRLVVNPKDDVSFRRVVNTPARGLGKTSLDKIEDLAKQMNLSMIEASIEILNSKTFTARTKSKLQSFLDILTSLRESCLEKEVLEFYHDLLQVSGYITALENDGSLEASSRIQNLEEFGNAIARYIELNPNEKHITQFLHHMALVSNAETNEEDPNTVTLMTLHIAKGLEYPVVFIAGLEEGLFPHMASQDSSDPLDMELEEERRLFYVGMTRAEKLLYLAFSKQRKVWGQNQNQAPSRFISEIPEEFLKNKINKRPSSFTERYTPESSSHKVDPFPDYEGGDSANGPAYRKGIRVYHPHFGSGVIHTVEGSGAKEKISVLFDDRTLKKFLAQYANLEMN